MRPKFVPAFVPLSSVIFANFRFLIPPEIVVNMDSAGEDVLKDTYPLEIDYFSPPLMEQPVRELIFNPIGSFPAFA